MVEDGSEVDTGAGAGGTRQQLVPGGSPTRELAVMVNVVTAYQRIRIRLDPVTLAIDTPVAWLGVVPHGRRVVEVARDRIREARIAPAFFPSRLVVAIGLAGLPQLVELPVPLAVACMLLGLLFVPLSVVASIRIDTLAGERHVVPVCWLERRAVRSLLDDLGGSAP